MTDDPLPPDKDQWRVVLGACAFVVALMVLVMVFGSR